MIIIFRPPFLLAIFLVAISLIGETFCSPFGQIVQTLTSNGNTIPLDPSQWGNAESNLGSFLDLSSGSRQNQLLRGNCQPFLSTSPKFVECEGQWSLFGVESEAKVVVVHLGEQNIAMGIEAVLTSRFNETILQNLLQLDPANSWLRTVHVDGDISASIRVASQEFEYDHGEFTRSLRIEINGVLNSESEIFNLNDNFLPTFRGTNVAISGTIPFFKDSYLLCHDGSRIGFDFQVDSIDFGPNIKLWDAKFGLVRFHSEDPVVTMGLHGKLTWAPANETMATFFVEAEWQSDTNTVILSGGLHEEWDNPAGLNWVKLQQAKATIEITRAKVADFEVHGPAEFRFWNTLLHHDIRLKAIDNFQQLFLETSLKFKQKSAIEVVQSIAESPVLNTTNLNEIRLTGQVHVVVTTNQYTHKKRKITYKQGATINAHVALSRGGELSTTVRRLCAEGDGQDCNEFQFRAHIPINFKGAVSNLKRLTLLPFSIRTPRVKVNDRLLFHGFKFEVSHTVAVAGTLAVTFPNRPLPVEFSLQAEGTIGIELMLRGSVNRIWKQAFNIPGFDIDKMWVELGVSPFAAGLSSFGAGGEIAIGKTLVEASGRISIALPIKTMGAYLRGRLSKLPMRELADAYNNMQVGHANNHGRSLRSLALMRREDIHPWLHIHELHVQFAPDDHIIDIDEFEVPFRRGLSLTGHVVLLGMKNCRFSLTTQIDILGPNFIADVDLELPTIHETWTAITREIFPASDWTELMRVQNETIVTSHRNASGVTRQRENGLEYFIRHLSKNIPQIVNVNVKGLNFRKLVVGENNAELSVELMFREEKHKFGLQIGFKHFRSSVVELIKDLIPWKEWFKEQECMIDAQCPSGEMCFHSQGDSMDNKCVEEEVCRYYMKIPIYGCTPCFFGNCGDSSKPSLPPPSDEKEYPFGSHLLHHIGIVFQSIIQGLFAPPSTPQLPPPGEDFSTDESHIIPIAPSPEPKGSLLLQGISNLFQSFANIFRKEDTKTSESRR